MEDFEMVVDTLRTIRAETIAIDKWMGQLATFLDKSNIEKDKHPELELAIQVLEVADNHDTKAEKLLDAIAYCKKESNRIHQRRKKIWHEIALLKIDNKELEDEISALGKEKPQIEDTKDVEADNESPIDMAPSGLMFIAVDDPRTGRLKRRRSAARVVIDTVKKAANTVIRSRSNSRARITHA